MNYLKKDLNNFYYADLNVIYAFYDWLSPQNVVTDQKGIKKRQRAIIKFIESSNCKKLVISRSVYIEWFQKMLDITYKESGQKSFSKFVKTNDFQKLMNKFSFVSESLEKKRKDLLFEFEWNFSNFSHPKNQSWDYFHVTMKQHNYKFITFDKNFSYNSHDYILLKMDDVIEN